MMRLLSLSFRLAALLTLLLQPSSSTWAQVWARTYAGPVPGDNRGTRLAVDTDNNVIVVGTSYNGAATGNDFQITKYDPAGATLWARRFYGAGSGSDVPSAVAVDPSGNIYVTGESATTTTGQDILTVKYSSIGTQQWYRRYNGAGNGDDSASALKVDAAGSVYVAGRVRGAGTDYDCVTLKYDTAGNRKWVQTYNGPVSGYDAAAALALDSTGNVVVCGQSNNGTRGGTDFQTMKYRGSDGVLLWARRFYGAGNGSDAALGVAINAGGDVFVVGTSTGTQGSDLLLVKYNSAGTQQYYRRNSILSRTADRDVSSFGEAIALDAQSNVYLGGRVFGSHYAEDYSNDFQFTFTLKYNATGSLLWLREDNNTSGPDTPLLRSALLAVDGSGNVVTTNVGQVNEGNYHFLPCIATTKYDPHGLLVWRTQWAGDGAGVPTSNPGALAIDQLGNILITGDQFLNDPAFTDILTLKYAP